MVSSKQTKTMIQLPRETTSSWMEDPWRLVVTTAPLEDVSFWMERTMDDIKDKLPESLASWRE